MAIKLMVCQLRKGDVLIGGKGGRFPVAEVEMLPGSLIKLKLENGREHVVMWFSSVVVEPGGATQ